jgi:hypothetical protein
MTPQIPAYLVTFETALRPFVVAIALGLIWMGAARMEGSARSRYGTAGVLSAVLIAWLAVAQYLGATNAYFATGEDAVPTVLFGLLIPLMVATAGVRLSRRIASLVSAIPLPWVVASQVYRVGGGHIPRALGGWSLAVGIRAARGDRRRCHWMLCRRRGGAIGAKVSSRSERRLQLVRVRNR